MNQYLLTEPFVLNDNATFAFNVQYNFLDTVSARRMLQDGYIHIKAELVDNKNGKVIGKFSDRLFEQNNFTLCDLLTYNVNTTGIGNKTVFLRVVIDYNKEAGYSICDLISDINILPKANNQRVSFTGNVEVKDYLLDQNYPNPFNPVTRINYQIPADGKVNLKIYDILGNEVITLVDEFKAAGRYTVEFNAGSLASGLYIYRIQAGEFTASQKMTLIK